MILALFRNTESTAYSVESFEIFLSVLYGKGSLKKEVTLQFMTLPSG